MTVLKVMTPPASEPGAQGLPTASSFRPQTRAAPSQTRSSQLLSIHPDSQVTFWVSPSKTVLWKGIGEQVGSDSQVLCKSPGVSCSVPVLSDAPDLWFVQFLTVTLSSPQPGELVCSLIANTHALPSSSVSEPPPFSRYTGGNSVTPAFRPSSPSTPHRLPPFSLSSWDVTGLEFGATNVTKHSSSSFIFLLL